MANPNVTKFQDSQAVTAREAEVTAASFDDGANQAASCAPGVGINIGGGAVVGTPEQFTLEDQFEVARTPQVSQVLGGLGYTDPADYPSSGGAEGNGAAHTEYVFAATNSDDGDGTVTPTGTANLASLAAGWTAV